MSQNPSSQDFRTEAARLSRLFEALSNRRFPELGSHVDGLLEWDAVLAGYASPRLTWKGVVSPASFPLLPQALETAVRRVVSNAAQDPAARELRAYFDTMREVEAQLLRVVTAEEESRRPH